MQSSVIRSRRAGLARRRARTGRRTGRPLGRCVPGRRRPALPELYDRSARAGSIANGVTAPWATAPQAPASLAALSLAAGAGQPAWACRPARAVLRAGLAGPREPPGTGLTRRGHLAPSSPSRPPAPVTGPTRPSWHCAGAWAVLCLRGLVLGSSRLGDVGPLARRPGTAWSAVACVNCWQRSERRLDRAACRSGRVRRSRMVAFDIGPHAQLVGPLGNLVRRLLVLDVALQGLLLKRQFRVLALQLAEPEARRAERRVDHQQADQTRRPAARAPAGRTASAAAPSRPARSSRGRGADPDGAQVGPPRLRGVSSRWCPACAARPSVGWPADGCAVDPCTERHPARPVLASSGRPVTGRRGPGRARAAVDARPTASPARRVGRARSGLSQGGRGARSGSPSPTRPGAGRSRVRG